MAVACRSDSSNRDMSAARAVGVSVGSVAGVPDYIGIEARRGSATLTVQADVRERRFRLNLAPGPDPVQLTVLTR